MAFQITGKIEVIGATTPITTKNGTMIYRRELVLDATRFNSFTGEPWENHPKFDLTGQNVNILDQFQAGQRVTVDFSLRGAKYQDKNTGEIKYFTSISAFRVALAENNYQSETKPTDTQPMTAQTEEIQATSPQPRHVAVMSQRPPEMEDNLPF